MKPIFPAQEIYIIFSAYLYVQQEFHIPPSPAYPLSRLRFPYQTPLLKRPNNLPHCFLHPQLPVSYNHLRMLRLLIRCADPRKIFNLPRPRLFIQPFWIARFGNFKRDVDVDFYKGDFAVFMDFAGEGTVRAVGGDEGGQGDGAGVGEEERDLLREAAVSA